MKKMGMTNLKKVETVMEARWYGLDLLCYTPEEVMSWLKIQWNIMKQEVNGQNYYPVVVTDVCLDHFREDEEGTDVYFQITAEYEDEIEEESPLHYFISECFRADLRFNA